MGATERLTIDLPGELYPVLERLAREQARAPQGQAGWIVREALRRADARQSKGEASKDQERRDAVAV